MGRGVCALTRYQVSGIRSPAVFADRRVCRFAAPQHPWTARLQVRRTRFVADGCVCRFVGLSLRSAPPAGARAVRPALLHPGAVLDAETAASRSARRRACSPERATCPAEARSAKGEASRRAHPQRVRQHSAHARTRRRAVQGCRRRGAPDTGHLTRPTRLSRPFRTKTAPGAE